MSTREPGSVIPSPDDVIPVALSVARAGWPIFPVLITAADRPGHTDKRPLTRFTDPEGSSTDAATIERWWRKTWNVKQPDGSRTPVDGAQLWIGVYVRGAGLIVVDVDVDKGDGRDGRANLAAAGLELDKTMRVTTLSGGRHHYYAAPHPYPADLSITKNDPVPGVDLRAGNGYVVYYGDKLVGRPTLAAAPAWATEAATRSAGAYSRGSGDVEVWRERLLPGKPSKALRRILDDVTDEGMTHDDMLATVTDLVKHAAEPGARTAYDDARDTYTRNYPQHARAWDVAVSGSVAALGMPPTRIPLAKRERRAIAERKRAQLGRPDTDADAVAEQRAVAPVTTAANHPSAGRRELADGPLAEEVTDRLRSRWAWGATTGLIRYRGNVWQPADVDVFTEHVRLALRDVLDVELRYALARDDGKRIAAIGTLAARKRHAAISSVAKGILANDAVATDAHPHLLNTPSGVVDLRDGSLSPHDPALYFTKITASPYDPDAVSDDWTTALGALPPKVAAWLQVRMGQAITGHTPDDAVLPLLEGSGANGKSTLLDAVRSSCGSYAVTVSDRLLLANPGDHPTELTDLMGARIAVAEELPEGRNLNVKRLKDVLGTRTLTARRIRSDNVTWTATHALFVSTNYRPIVAETDHGTWRRLALVTFPFRFIEPGRTIRAANDRLGDPDLGRRLAEAGPAVLAWLVRGAVTWYGRGRVMPPPPKRVRADTHDWRLDADPVLAYVGTHLELADGYAIPASDLVVDFNTYLESRSQRPWSEQTIAQRFADHVALPDVEKVRVRFGKDATPSRSIRSIGRVQPDALAWLGVRFRMTEPSVPLSAEVLAHAARQL